MLILLPPVQYLLIALDLSAGRIKVSGSFGVGANSNLSMPFTILEFLLVGPIPPSFLRSELIS